jgi:hypothetical protein
MRISSETQVRLGLAAAIVLQLAIVGLFYFDIIHDPNHRTGTLIFHHGGDEVAYFELAQSLLDGQPVKTQFSLGFPLMLVPWIVALQPGGPDALKVPIAVFHALFLFPLAQALFLSLALRLFRNPTTALLALLLWTVLPIVLYLALALAQRAELGAIWAVHLPWLQMLSDPPAAFLTLFSFWLMFRLLDTGGTRRQWIMAIVLGFVCGWAMLVRINTILTVAIVFLMLGVMKRWSALAVTGVTLLITYTPQLIYNSAFFSTPFTTGYQAVGPLPQQGLMNVSYVIQLFLGNYAIVAWIVMLSMVIAIALGAWALWRKTPLGAITTGLWWAVYLAFFSLYYYSWDGGFARFLLPAYPGLVLLVGGALNLLLDRTPRPRTSSGRL